MVFPNILAEPDFPREFMAVAACCRWPPSERRNEAVRAAIDGPFDWNRFERIVQRHRVVGLAQDGLARAGATPPSNVAGRLRTSAARVAHQNLLHAAESLRVQDLFDEAKISMLFVKGATLAQLAYGSIALKHSWDIDLLVRPDDVPEALRLLASAGYHPYPPLPPLSDEKFRRWLRFGREYILYHETRAVCIELHWRLMENRHFLPGISVDSRSQNVPATGAAGLRTLSTDDLFLYLCVHGAVHGWAQFKWLADAAALVSSDRDGDIERRLEAAKKVNADVCVAQFILLRDRFLSAPKLAEPCRRLRRSTRYKWLEHTALNALQREDIKSKSGNAPFERLPVYLSHFLLNHGIRSPMRELWNKLNGPYDMLYRSSSNALDFLYPFVRVASWIRRGGRVRLLPAPRRVKL